MAHRLGDQPGQAIQAPAYGEVVQVGDFAVSLHPAGHRPDPTRATFVPTQCVMDQGPRGLPPIPLDQRCTPYPFRTAPANASRSAGSRA